LGDSIATLENSAGANSGQAKGRAKIPLPGGERLGEGGTPPQHLPAEPGSAARRPQAAAEASKEPGAAIHIAAPATPAPLLRQLGPPPFWTPPGAFAGHLEPVYRNVTARILRLALGDADEI
jgi:hypothetical protein